MVPSAGPGQVTRHTEERMARMIAYTRAGTTPFVFIPLLGWDHLQYPVISVLSAVAAAAEATWFFRRVWRSGDLRDPLLIWGDVAFCVAVMLIGTRAAFPADRNVITTEFLPFSLVASAAIGLGLGLGRKAVPGLVALCTSWMIALHPYFALKLVSDLLGFLLWYCIALLIGRELRTLAEANERAQEATRRAERLLAEQERLTMITRHRELTHREIHDHLLPIVDHVAAGQLVDPGLARAARLGAHRARRFIMDPRAVTGLPFEQLMEEVCDVYIDRGLALTSVILVDSDPPQEVGEAVAAAVREALTNVLKHAGEDVRVNLFVESGADGVEVVIRDRGRGFAATAVRPGGGFLNTFAAVARHNGECLVTSEPGAGSRVTIRWPREADAE
ncbi:sensor histidine kinase [Nonomuraea lactucae]|uniref:sensor histidine kinase n=1 Tax=Nonomuraea lactucae TaxID=2249762 RepID=UPI0013B38B9C|nr:ATP-binding protein [Nonomuraea lactucae]